MQRVLPGFKPNSKLSFGGSSRKGNPKEARLFDSKRSLHVVMRSRLARGEKSFLRQHKKVAGILNSQAERFGVRVYDWVNAGNHVHLLVKVHTRRLLRAFLRSIAGLLARMTMDWQRGRGSEKEFWDARPYTRIVHWGKDFNGVKNYLVLNSIEVEGASRQDARCMLQSFGFYGPAG